MGQESETGVPYYWKSLDWDRLMTDYPPPPIYAETVGRASAEFVRELQEKRALERVTEAWQVPFYRRHWSAAGLTPSDIVTLDDLDKIPTFTSDDFKASIEEASPFGLHHPFDRTGLASFAPLKIQTSGGTTGMPRVMAFDAMTWEVQGIQAARAFWAQGARPGDVIQIPFTTALGNAPWSAYVGIHHWLGAVPVTSGSGVVTSSERQLELASTLGTNGWYAMGEYMARLVEVAEGLGFNLHQLPTRYVQSFLGADGSGELRKLLEEAWGAPVYDNYGTHEIGLVGFECHLQNGRHISEDTVYLQVVDVDDATRPMAMGQTGNLVATVLHRSVPPIIRYNVRDTFALTPRERCGCGLTTTRLSNFIGRTDEMIKLRGQNVYPLACQDAVLADPDTNGQFLCVVHRLGEGLLARDHMTIRVERADRSVNEDRLRERMLSALKRDLGVRVDVEIVEAGDLTPHTRLGGEGKVRRLLDLRQ